MVQPPGWGIGCEVYQRSLAPLESDFTLVYHDPRGTGRSQSPAHPESINVGWLVEDLDALRAHLSLDTFALIGHSHGGLTALNYALKYQRHLTHLVVVESQLVGGVDTEHDTQQALSELIEDPTFAEAYEFFQSEGGFSGFARAESDGDVSSFLTRILPLYFKNTKHAAALQDYARTHRISRTALLATGASDGRFPVVEQLSTIQVPTLVLVGRYDIFCPPTSAQITHDRIGGSRRMVFENSGHFPWIEEADLFFSVVTDFIKGKRRSCKRR